MSAATDEAGRWRAGIGGVGKPHCRASECPHLFAIPAFPLPAKTLYGAARLCHRQSYIFDEYQRLGGKSEPLEGGLTRYISTRGEAPVLGFCDVMLTGLARDGGLYVPEAWPQLSAQTIAGFFGRPYWEVAVDVIRPFVGNEISDADLGRMANEAYATFRHPAVVPLDQIGPNQFLLELFHGPTLAFKDVAMQLISRLMDHVLAKRAQRTTIVVATSGDTGGAAVDAFAGLDNVDLIVLFPHGRNLRRAAQDDDHNRRRQCSRPRCRRHLRRLPGDREGALQRSPFSRRGGAVRGQFHQLGADRGAGGVLFHLSGGARGAGATNGLYGADRKFRRHLRRPGRQAHGPAGQVAAKSPPTSTISCRAPSRPASTKCARFTHRPHRRWIFRSRRISNGYCSRRVAAMRLPSAG